MQVCKTASHQQGQGRCNGCWVGCYRLRNAWGDDTWLHVTPRRPSFHVAVAPLSPWVGQFDKQHNSEQLQPWPLPLSKKEKPKFYGPPSTLPHPHSALTCQRGLSKQTHRRVIMLHHTLFETLQWPPFFPQEKDQNLWHRQQSPYWPGWPCWPRWPCWRCWPLPTSLASLHTSLEKAFSKSRSGLLYISRTQWTFSLPHCSVKFCNYFHDCLTNV